MARQTIPAKAQPQTAGQCHALPLTTRKIGRAAITETVEIDQRERLLHTSLALGFGNFGYPQTIADIFCDRHMRPERIVLEDDTDLPLLRWYVTINMGNAAVTNVDFAAIDVFKTCNHPQKRGLATAGWSENSNKLAILHIKRHFRQGLKLVEGLGNRSDFQSRHGSTPFGRRRANRFVASISMNVTATARMDMAAA